MADNYDIAKYYGISVPDNSQPDAATPQAAPQYDVAKYYKLEDGGPELTDAQRDTVTRWGLDPRKFTRQNAPIESAEGLRDPATRELIVSGRAPTAATHSAEWGTVQAIANGYLQGLGPKLQAAAESLRSDAPAGAYAQAKAHYEAQRGAFNADHPWTGQAPEIASSVVSAIPLTLYGAGALEAGGAMAARQLPALARAEPVANFLAGRGGANYMAPDAGNALVRAGKMLLRGGSLATAGAEAGAGNALLSQNLSDAPLGEQVADNAALGAGLGLGIPAAWFAAKTAGTVGKSLAEPFFESGQRSLANDALYRTSVNPEYPFTTPQGLVTGPDVIVPGSIPTLAQATGNAALAASERAMRGADPLTNVRFVEREQANKVARNELMAHMEGNANSLDIARAERDAVTTPMREDALANAGPVDLNDTRDTGHAILASPSGKRPVVRNAVNDALAALHDPQTGQLEYRADRVYAARQAIDDLMSSTSTNSAKNYQLAAAELRIMHDSLTDALTQAAPGFRDYLNRYAEMSRDINVQEFLQKAKVTDSDLNVQKGRVNALLDQIERGQALPGIHPTKSFGDEEMLNLHALHDDLRRAGNSNLGRAAGSDTHQNIATNNILAKAGVPLGVIGAIGSGNPLYAGVGWLAQKAYQAKDRAIYNRVADMMLDPNTVLRPPSQSGVLPQSLARIAGGRIGNIAPYSVPIGNGANALLRIAGGSAQPND
jgi:hypothetical protein